MSQLPVLTPTLLLLFSLFTLIGGMLRRSLPHFIALTGLTLAFISSCSGMVQVIINGPQHYYLGNWIPPIGIEYVLDYFSAFMSVIITLIALLTLFYARLPFIKEIPGKTTVVYTVILLFICGLTGIIVTGDLFNLYVFLEIASLSAYALIAIGVTKAPVAAFRYVIIGTIGACFYLLGVGFIYFATGTLNMADAAGLITDMHNSKLILAGVIFIFTGIALKMAIFPLHIWLPDAYTYAPSAVTALIAPLMTKVCAYVIIRMLISVFGISYLTMSIPITTILSWLAATGIIVTSIMAITQKGLQRMLAYSSISQICYIALGIGLANPFGLIGAILHILNHAVMKACLFQVSGEIRYTFDHTDISKFAGIGKKLPLPMAAFTVGALSMIGIPPTAGFFSKWYLVLGCVQNNNWALAAIIIIGSLITAVYFFKVLEQIYLKQPADMIKHEKKSLSSEMLAPTMLLAFFIIVFGVINVLIVENVIQPFVNSGF